MPVRVSRWGRNDSEGVRSGRQRVPRGGEGAEGAPPGMREREVNVSQPPFFPSAWIREQGVEGRACWRRNLDRQRERDCLRTGARTGEVRRTGGQEREEARPWSRAQCQPGVGEIPRWSGVCPLGSHHQAREGRAASQSLGPRPGI